MLLAQKSMMRKIQNQLIKNFLTQWGTEEKNQKIKEYVISKKIYNPVV